MITILRRCVARNTWVTTFMVKCHSLTLQQNRVRPITSYFEFGKTVHRNYHHIKTTCRMQHLGCYLEVQGHIIKLQQNHVRPITSLFKIGFYNYF